MKQFIKQSALMLAALAMVLGLAVAPVSAEDGATGSGSAGSGSSGPGGTSGGDSDKTATTDRVISANDSPTESEAGDSGSGAGSGKLHAKSDKLLTDLRQKGKEHSQVARQKACVQRQKSLDRRTTNYAAAAQRHLDTFNKIFTKVQAFHDSKKLTVTNYDTLVAAATAKQTAAQSAVDTLKALDVKIDCTQSDPASTVATVKTAVSNARTALQDYRKSIKDVVKALKGASTAQDTSDTTSTGGDQ
jgi:hypothetical protein